MLRPPSRRAIVASLQVAWNKRDYETNAGEKRTVFEVVADEIGPSLRWATAQVERTERSGGFGGGGAQSQSPQAAPDPVYGDEEPF